MYGSAIGKRQVIHDERWFIESAGAEPDFDEQPG